MRLLEVVVTLGLMLWLLLRGVNDMQQNDLPSSSSAEEFGSN